MVLNIFNGIYTKVNRFGHGTMGSTIYMQMMDHSIRKVIENYHIWWLFQRIRNIHHGKSRNIHHRKISQYLLWIAPYIWWLFAGMKKLKIPTYLLWIALHIWWLFVAKMEMFGIYFEAQSNNTQFAQWIYALHR